MRKSLAVLSAALALAACASLPPPSAEHMAALPVVPYGQPAPASGDFILHYPAGAALPVSTAISGSLLAQEGKADFQVSLKRDIYVYKTWASWDGKNWQRGRELVTGTIAMTLPGERDGRAPGTLTAQFNVR